MTPRMRSLGLELSSRFAESIAFFHPWNLNQSLDTDSLELRDDAVLLPSKMFL